VSYQDGVMMDRTDQIDAEREALTLGHLVRSSPVAQLLLRWPVEGAEPVIEALNERLDLQSGTSAMLMIDLDDFKEVNDSLGHETGDRLLHKVGRRIAGRARPGDFVARLGGDEFAVILFGANGDVARERAASLVNAINRPFTIGHLRLRVRASIGVAEFGEDASTASDLVRCADVAMYCAKARGSEVERYASEIDNFGSERLSLVADLEVAISEGHLRLAHQPVIDVATGRVVGTEVLSRWTHPRHGVIRPDIFIELAEVSGQMKDLTRWVVRQALDDLRRFNEAGHDLEVSINLSVRNRGDLGHGSHHLEEHHRVGEIARTAVHR